MSNRKQAPSKATTALDAIKLLTEDHKQAKQLFKDYEQLVSSEGPEEEKQKLALRICDMLRVHTTIEEEIFYPAARQVPDAQDLLDEAVVEHAGAKELIAQIESMEPAEELYDAKVKVLGEAIEHHVKEEEDEMFPKVRKGEFDLQQLGEQMLERKEELLAGLDTGDA